jgi:hypothetical protein
MTHTTITTTTLTHSQMQDRIIALMTGYATNIQKEKTLANGKIADVIYEQGLKTIIIEVKSYYKESYVEAALAKYGTECDYLYIATPYGAIPPGDDRGPLWWQDNTVSKVGLIEIADGVIVVRRHPVDLKTGTAREPSQDPGPSTR